MPDDASTHSALMPPGPVPPDPQSFLEPLRRLSRDIRRAALTMSADQARYLVDAYYVMQRDRCRAGNQDQALGKALEPHEVITWLRDNAGILERNVKSVLDAYSSASVTGRWSKSVVGIGPVIAAGLLAHIDITRAPTVGHMWRFAGLDPTTRWDKGTKRPWNASLKRLCWIMGECFVKTSNHAQSFYGPLYTQRKALEQARNEAGAFADQAARSLLEKDWRRDTATRASYQAGRLPPARIHLRAERWATKIFLAHWHQVAYWEHYGRLPPRPYVLDILGHADQIQVPNWPF